MFKKQIKNTFEGSPLEVIRRYAPWMVGAFAGVGMTVVLYQVAYHGGQSMIDEANESVTGIMSESGDKTEQLVNGFGENNN